MALAQEAYRLLTRNLRYACTREAVREIPKLLAHLAVGARPQPKKAERFYTDLHVHIDENESMREVVETASERVDLFALVEREAEHMPGHMSYSLCLRKLEEEGIEHQRLGDKVVRVDYNPIRPLYIVKSLEVYVKENQGVVMVGTPISGLNERTLSMENAMAMAQDMGAFYHYDHIASIGTQAPLFFRCATKEEMNLRREWIDRYDPVIEIANHQNTLWMWPSDAAAQLLQKETGVVGIGNSDTHRNTREIGLTRTSVLRGAFDGYDGESVISSLKEMYSRENSRDIQVERGYASAVEFLWYLGKPEVQKILSGKKRGVLTDGK